MISAAVAGREISLIKLSFGVAADKKSCADRLGWRKVMLAERDHRARLRTLGALGMLRDEAHLVADGELVEAVIRDAVVMKIDLAAIGTQDEPAILLWQEPHDPPMVGHSVQLDVAAFLTNVIFEQPAGRVESVADRDMNILMGVVPLGIAPDDDLAPRNLEVDSHPEQITLLVTGVPALDDDTAGDDPIAKAFEFLGALMYSCRDRIRRIHVAKRNLKWHLHRILHCVSRI
jgi:hypothetical protein